jgi:hypothetical protein
MERGADPSRSGDSGDRENARALLALAQVIPGKDPTEEGALHRDMTSETLRVLSVPLPQRHALMNELIERCSSRGWSLIDVYALLFL